MKIHYRLIMLFSFYIMQICIVEAALKDPRTRDEDISNTIVDVTVTNEGELYRYDYTIKSSETNLGTISGLMIDLKCELDFGEVSIPVPDKRLGYIGNISRDGKHVPAELFAEYGTSNVYGITIFNAVSWGVYVQPGMELGLVSILSPAPPGLITYKLKPAMANDPTWDYSSYEECDPTVPWIEDFTVLGKVIGPACSLEPPTVNLFQGSSFGYEPSNINELLQYSSPLKDRFHVAAGTKETEIHIFYGKDIDAKTFKVEPAWLKHYFNPVAGSDEQVTLPLKKARNKIKLSVHAIKATGTTRKENESHHSYKDTDVFEIRIDENKK
jgi:hypothetical protein